MERQDRHPRNKVANEEAIEKIKSVARQSPWGVSPGYTVTVDTGRFMDNVHNYHEMPGVEKLDDFELLALITPEFQRDADKWDREMQIRYIQNIICGCPTKILFYTLKYDNYQECFLLDGQQRSHSMAAWMNDQFKVFGYYFSEINNRRILANGHIQFEIYHFESHVEACKFYIQMNEGMTHSQDDIERARAYIAKHEKA